MTNSPTLVPKGGPPAHTCNIEERVKAVRTMVDIFRSERTVYMVACCVSLLLLFWSGFLMLRNKPDAASVSLLFGSTGVTGFSISQVIRMYTEGMKLLMQCPLAGNSGQ